MPRGQVLAGNFIDAIDVQDELDFLTPLTVIATDNPTTSSDAVLSADSQLLLAYEADASYELALDIYYGAGTTADFKWALTFTDATVNYGAEVLDATTSTVVAQVVGLAEASGTAHTVGGAGVSSFRYIRLRGNFVTTEAGTLRFQWSQGTSTVENTVRKAGSQMTLKRVA